MEGRYDVTCYLKGCMDMDFSGAANALGGLIKYVCDSRGSAIFLARFPLVSLLSPHFFFLLS